MKALLQPLLDAADGAARDNVRLGRGGPFAASLHLYDRVAGVMMEIAPPAGNAVLETGLASAHAEDRLIAPGNIAALKVALQDMGAGAAEIFLVSSAESCPACHAKLEILARNLQAEGLIAPGRFTIVYGATYEDSLAVAGFNDGAYHDDFQLPPGTGLIRQEHAELSGLRPEIQECLQTGYAVVDAGGMIYTGAGAMPEVAAIQSACSARKAQGLAEPWNLEGAALYTCTREIGPLAYAESQWANIGRWLTVKNDIGAETAECAGISNADLFSIIGTRPYDHPDSALRFLHLTPFENAGQKEWRLLCEGGNVRVYNGAG